MRITNVTIGVPTFSNFVFSKMTIEHIIKTVKRTNYKLYVIIGKSDDQETIDYCRSNGILHTVHEYNKGLPASVNDIYDFAFKINKHDAAVVVGNDVLPYWDAIDQLVDYGNQTDYDWISGTVVSINGLISKLPETRKYFHGGAKEFDFHGTDLPEWLEKYKLNPEDSRIVDLANFNKIGDSFNMNLFTKELFHRIGYVDVNFWPGGYFSDNDYAKRALVTKSKLCRLQYSKYFHFWSRSIHQGGTKEANNKYFPMNQSYYSEKWGEEPSKEKFTRPWDGKKGTLNITSRVNEEKMIKEWANK